MRTTRALKSIVILLIGLLVIQVYSGCEGTEPDVCDRTVKPEIIGRLMASVTILDSLNQPVPGKDVNLTIYKIPCMQNSKGHFYFNGVTNADGKYSTNYLVSYDLRNSQDKVVINALAPGLDAYNVQPNAVIVEFTYSEFGSEIKTVDLYIYDY